MDPPDDVRLMSHVDEWLREAKECLESAQASRDSRTREAWINLAAEWMKLAAAAPETVAPLHTRDTQRPN